MLGWVDTRQTQTWKELLLAFRRQKSGRLNYTLKTSSTCNAVHYIEVLAFVYTSLAHSMDQFGTKTENTRMAKITLWADLILKWLSFANTDRQMLSLYGQNRRGRGRGSKCRFMQTLCPIYPHWHLSIFIYFNVYILTFLRLGNMRQECPGPSLKVRLVLVKYNYVFFGCLSDPRAIVVLLCPYVSKSIGILSFSSYPLTKL